MAPKRSKTRFPCEEKDCKGVFGKNFSLRRHYREQHPGCLQPSLRWNPSHPKNANAQYNCRLRQSPAQFEASTLKDARTAWEAFSSNVLTRREGLEILTTLDNLGLPSLQILPWLTNTLFAVPPTQLHLDFEIENATDEDCHSVMANVPDPEVGKAIFHYAYRHTQFPHVSPPLTLVSLFTEGMTHRGLLSCAPQTLSRLCQVDPENVGRQRDMNIIMACDNHGTLRYGTVISPAGAITAPHIDHTMVPVLFTMFFGLKVFIFWPATAKNLQIYGDLGLHRNAFASSVQLGLERLESGQCSLLKEKDIFVLPPGGIHAVLSISNSALGSVQFVAAEYLDAAVTASRWERELAIRSLNENCEGAKKSLEFQQSDIHLWRKLGLKRPEIRTMSGELNRCVHTVADVEKKCKMTRSTKGRRENT